MSASDTSVIAEKIARARDHLRLFEREAESYFKECGAMLDVKVNPQMTEMCLCLTIAREVPPRLSVIIGDCVHNARSALDNIVCALVRTKNPTSNCHGRQFPAFVKIEDYRAKRNHVLKGVPEDAQVVIDGLQPCSGLDGGQSAAWHAVSILNTLSNRDKHRAPVLTAAYSRKATFVARLPGGDWGLVLDGPLYANTNMDIPFRVELLRHRNRIEACSLFNLHFQDRSLYGEEPVLSLLTFSLDFVESEIFSALKPFLGK